MFDRIKNLFGGGGSDAKPEPQLSAADRRKYVFTRYLPEPSEATINVLKAFAQSGKISKAGDFKLAVSSLEAPSSRLALDLFMREASGNPNAHGSVGVAHIQEPDPREPVLRSKYALWIYEGTDPRPAVNPPDKATADQVGAIAATPFDITAWKQQAKDLAAKIGVGRINDLMATMVHPPKNPKVFPIWVWLQRVQIAAALVIAYLPEADWQKSQRRKALLGLALGPMDWTTGAALMALTELAQDNPKIAAELAESIRRLMDIRPDEGGVCYEYLMACCGLRIPNVPDDLRRSLKQLKSEFEG